MGCKHEVVFAVLQRDIAHCETVGEVIRLELCPALSAIDADKQSELGAEIENVGVDPILLDHMRIAAHARRSRPDQALPTAAEISRSIEIGLHVAGRVA